jgi:hypothetical protein
MDTLSRRLATMSLNGAASRLVGEANKQAWQTFRETGLDTAAMESLKDNGRLGEKHGFDVPEGMLSANPAVRATEAAIFDSFGVSTTTPGFLALAARKALLASALNASSAAQAAGVGVLVITPTGKSALRVREATGLDARTIHRWIYKVVEDPKTGGVKFVRRNSEEIVKGKAFV